MRGKAEAGRRSKSSFIWSRMSRSRNHVPLLLEGVVDQAQDDELLDAVAMPVAELVRLREQVVGLVHLQVGLEHAQGCFAAQPGIRSSSLPSRLSLSSASATICLKDLSASLREPGGGEASGGLGSVADAR